MKRKNLKPMIISALLAVGFGATSVGTSFALFTDKTETSISVTSGKVDVKNELTLVSYTSSVDGTNENLEGEDDYTNLKVGSSFVLDNGNIVINKMVPGDKLTVKLTSKNKSNVKTKTRYVLSHATTTGKKDLMPALTITFDAGEEMPAVDLFKWKAHDPASSSEGDALYSLTATIEFVNHDDGIVANTEGRDNQYQDAACSIGLALESVQANAATSLIDDINNYLSAQEVMEGKNATMHDAMEDVDELNGTATPKVYTLDLVKTDYAWGVNEDQFVAKAAIAANKYNYFAVYDSMPATNEQTYSVYAAPSWTSTNVNAVVGFDAGDAQNISQVSYVRNGTNVEAQNVVIRTNSHNTVLTIDAEKDTVNHYGKASKVEITAVDNNNCYNEHGDVAGNINLKKGKVVVHNDCSAGAVVIDMTAAELATVTTLSADNSANKEVPIILNTSEVLWAANPNNGLINPITNNIIYSSTGGTLPEGFDTMTKEQKEAAIASASDGLIQGVAAIKNTGYPTLQAAIDAAQDGDVIVLLKNIALGSSERVKVNKTITLNMNGKTITGSAQYLIQVGSQTTIGHLTIRGNGSISSSGMYMLTVCTASTLDIYDGNYVGLKSTFNVLGGIVTTYGGSFSSTATGGNYLAYLGSACSCNFLGGTFTTPTDGNYGIYITNASVVNLGLKGEAGPSFSTWRPCISSNGSESHECTINIYSGTYKANRNNTTIDDQNVIQLANATTETQTLNIYGGYFEQTSHLENSCMFTLKYSGIIKLNITGGTFNYGNNSKLFCGYGTDASGYPSASNILVNVENDIIPKNVTIEVYGKGVARLQERDFVVNQ